MLAPGAVALAPALAGCATAQATGATARSPSATALAPAAGAGPSARRSVSIQATYNRAGNPALTANFGGPARLHWSICMRGTGACRPLRNAHRSPPAQAEGASSFLPPPGWGNPTERGMLTVVSPTVAVFTSPAGDDTFLFTPRRRPPFLCS
ncbi:MAG: hypothetical protein ACRDMX_10275 [Solirubrobacteraceae bacterium]